MPEDCEVFEGCEFRSHRLVFSEFEYGGVGDLDGQVVVGARGGMFSRDAG